MQFHIDVDTLEAVAGWLVPTHPDAVPVLSIKHGDAPAITFNANVNRPDLVQLGLHATGMVGFVVSHQTVPGLRMTGELELRDAETGLLIYRRERQSDKKLKLMRFTQGFGVQSTLDDVLERHFTLAYDNCSEYASATKYALLNNLSCESLYAAGAVSYAQTIDLVRERSFLTIMLVKDPVEALAETLLALQATREGDASTAYKHLLAPVFASDAGLMDANRLAGLLADLTPDQRYLLTNPAVRLLACRDEPAEHRHVAIALEHLASLHVVGVESAVPVFAQALAETVQMDLLAGYARPRDSAVLALTETLLAVDDVLEMLALDMIFHDLVREAVASTA